MRFGVRICGKTLRFPGPWATQEKKLFEKNQDSNVL